MMRTIPMSDRLDVSGVVTSTGREMTNGEYDRWYSEGFEPSEVADNED
jgi:hypothetical protein